jgi:hypothetical protein
VTIDALKFFQAYIREMIEIGGENLPKTISSGLGADLAKIYKKKGLISIEDGLKEIYSVLGAKIEIKQINPNQLEITIKHHDTFCPIGGKYDPNKSELFQNSICIPYTVGFLNEMNSKYKYSWDIHECILNTGNNCCRYSLYLENRDQFNKINIA